MGSTGVCPLTVVATVPEICRHMSNLIVRAKDEVFLATNYWKYSEGSRLICNALKELSKRALGENRHVVVKIMYDRGDAKQLVTPHQTVPPVRMPKEPREGMLTTNRTHSPIQKVLLGYLIQRICQILI